MNVPHTSPKRSEACPFCAQGAEDSSYKYLCVNINKGLYCKIMSSIYNLLKSRFCSTLMNYMAEGFEFVYDTELFGLQSRILVCE